MTKEELDRLLATALLKAQERIAELGNRLVMPIGVPLYCRVVWSTAHRGEPFLFCGPNPGAAIDVSALNDAAARRIAKCGDTFPRWWSVQTSHEQFAFVCCMSIQVVKNAQPSGLVVLPASALPS